VLRPITDRFLESVLEDDPAVEAFAFLPGTGYPYAGIGPQGNDYQATGSRDARIMGLQAASAPDNTVVQRRRIGGADTTAGARILTDAMEEPVLAVGAAVNRQAAFELRHTIRDSALVVGAAMLLLFVVITFLVTRRIIDPLVSLNQAARKLAEGEPDMPAVPVLSLDEVGNLTAAFNDMASRLRRRLRGLELLNTGMGGLNARRTVDGIVETVAQVFEDTLHPHTVFLALHEPERGVFHVLGGRHGGQPLKGRRIQSEGSFLLQAMNTGGPERIRGLRWFELGRSENRLFQVQDGGPDEVVTVPLDYQGDPIGLLVLTYRDAPIDDRPVDQESLMVLTTMADQIAAALENARLYSLAVEDPLTGLYLQGYFEGRLKDEIQRASRHDRTLILVRFRVEEAPIVASRFGPAGLNHLLRAVARHLRSVLTPEDLLAARLENNEFALALVETDRKAGFEVAHRIASVLLSHPVAVGKGRPIKLTPRFGLAAFPEDASSFEFLLEAANRAMETSDMLEADVEKGHLSSREPTPPPIFEEAGIVLKSPRSLELVRTVERIARSPMTVLITGETGTGKEVFAELIHRRSNRARKPLIKVNCAALPELLLESELFGHERGAFTGAYKKKIGRFEMADGGTLFLDEIGEISLSTQVKLLRVLQDKKIERLGGTESLSLDVRIIAATNQDMLGLIRLGKFREDLYYRLNVISLEVPPLRERKEEIPALVDSFVREFNRENGDVIVGIRPQTMDKLYNSSWPGNIRELKNVLERAMLSVDRGSYLEPNLVNPQDTQVRSQNGSANTGETEFPASVSTLHPAAHHRSTATRDLEESVPSSPSSSSFSSPDLKTRQRDLLRYLENKCSITNQEYVAMMGVSTRTGLRDLNTLIEMGLLQRVGNRRAATYKIKDRGKEPD
jgi:diguanylate cyclase (GGDEF)-like protein